MNTEYILEYSANECFNWIMNMPNAVSDTDELKEKILEAAENRFLTYGYGKTTMAEIATDVDMSAANLYRYFQNKHDIAAECAERCMSERNAHIRNAVRKPNLSATERLHVFAQEAFRFNIDSAKENTKINELVEHISNERQELVHEKIDAQSALISEILAHGNETGEFDVDDVVKTGRTIYASLILFDVPIFLGLFSEEEFERTARSVVNLLIEGLKKR